MPDDQQQTAGGTSTDIQPVNGPDQDDEETSALHRSGTGAVEGAEEDPSRAPEEDNHSRIPGDPRGLNEGQQPEQPDRRG